MSLVTTAEPEIFAETDKVKSLALYDEYMESKTM